MGSLNLCCHKALPNARLLPYSSAVKTIITIKPCISSSSSTINHHRHYRNSPTAVASTAKQLTSPELVALEYADLNINYDNVSQEVGHVRIRQHVNPFAPSFSIPAPVPNWSEVFKDSTLPLMVDIGSGSGRFLLWLAKRNPNSQNYLGLEIRQKVQNTLLGWPTALNSGRESYLFITCKVPRTVSFKVDNKTVTFSVSHFNDLLFGSRHFMFANATISFKELVSTYPGPLMLVSILCPDPHFKKRHHKRRVVQKPLVDSIVNNLMPGGQVFIESDVLEVAVNMRDLFDEESDLIQHINGSMECDEEGWLINNPMGIRTEREIHAEFEGAKIYRSLYQKLLL